MKRSEILVVHLSQTDISRKAMEDAGYDPARFGKRNRSTVEINRKHQAKRGYQKHKGRDTSTDSHDSTKKAPLRALIFCPCDYARKSRRI